MSVTWKAEQVLSLAPDDSSAKAGKDLANARKWPTLGCDERAAWGECQGSGSKPYQVEIDLNEPAFKCTCPSRKFPCKHSLGLFLLLVNQPGAFTANSQPQWVIDWLAGRDKRSEQKEVKKENGDKAPDPAAQAKRAASMEAKVTAGVQELEIWLKDMVRGGLASAQERPYSFWESVAARMVDAQAPGLARELKDMAGIASTGEGWQGRLLERLSRLYLLIEGYKRIESLPEPVQADIRACVGWTQNQDELLAQSGVRDRWLVLGQRVYEEDRLRVQRSWLCGENSGRAAMFLSFTHMSQPMTDVGLVPGTALDAELVYYPGAYPLRALIREKLSEPKPVQAVPGYATIQAAVESYASALASNPWINDYPMALQAAAVVKQDDIWLVRDKADDIIPINPNFMPVWELLAISGGHPITLFGEWNGEDLLPLSAYIGGRFFGF